MQEYLRDDLSKKQSLATQIQFKLTTTWTNLVMGNRKYFRHVPEVQKY